jgi:heptosyltransferase-2
MQAAKEKIAVVLPNHLGDVVMATPALRALRRGRPEAEIIAVIQEILAPILGGCPWIDRVWTHRIYSAGGQLARLGRRWAVGKQLKGTDCMIVLPNSFSSALLAAASRAPCRVGYRRNARGWLLTDPLPPPREGGKRVPIAMERYYLDLVCRLGCLDTGTSLELFTDPGAERACDVLFAEHGIESTRPLVCLAPGAGFGPSKIWPLSYVAEVARALLDDGLQVALVHAPSEQALADEILALMGSEPVPARLGGEGMDLSLLKSVLARANLLICNDAGARHIAAAFQVPTLVLMGPTSIRYTNLNLKLTRLLREPVSCSPCQLKECPIDHRCMTRLTPSRVIDEAHAALSNEGWRGDIELEFGS